MSQESGLSHLLWLLSEQGCGRTFRVFQNFLKTDILVQLETSFDFIEKICAFINDCILMGNSKFLEFYDL